MTPRPNNFLLREMHRTDIWTASAVVCAGLTPPAGSAISQIRVWQIISMSAKSFNARLMDWRATLRLSPAAASQFISENKTGEPLSLDRLLELERGATPLPTEKFVLECLMMRGAKSGSARRIS